MKWEPLKWAKWYYHKFDVPAKEEVNKLILNAGHGQIVDTVITSMDVDAQSNEEAAELDGQDGLWAMFYNDCGTGAIAWLRESSEVQGRTHAGRCAPIHDQHQLR